jgi:hypothetical protein
VFIGQNHSGQWVAQEQNGLYGGLFVNRAQAIKYALSENGHHPETIVELSREIELDMSARYLPSRRVARHTSIMENPMAESRVTPGIGQILDTMISLTRLTPLQRVIVADGDSMALYLELRQRGFIWATTPALCRHKRTLHAIGFIASQGSGTSIDDLEQILPFLTINAALALLVGSGENGLNIGSKLEGLGFRIEAGVRCAQGLVLSASRQGYEQMARAA